jgi:hypothetical protein
MRLRGEFFAGVGARTGEGQGPEQVRMIAGDGAVLMT